MDWKYDISKAIIDCLLSNNGTNILSSKGRKLMSIEFHKKRSSLQYEGAVLVLITGKYGEDQILPDIRSSSAILQSLPSALANFPKPEYK